ncbi:flavin monoamine oxidase family protein [Geodermatophilus nigrescens]
MNAVDHDVVVVGAGLAGLAAARRCLTSGLSVRVLEARDRVGGRTWSRDIAGRSVDLGAEWVSPGHHRAVMAELDRYGMSTTKAPEPATTTWSLEGTPRTARHALGDAQRREFERLCAAVDEQAARVDVDDPRWHEATAADDMPMADYLDRWKPDPLVRSYFLLNAFALMGADERRYTAAHFLHEVAAFGSCAEAFTGESDRIAGGCVGIARALAGDVGADALSFGSVVTGVAVFEEDGTVEVRTGEGALRARAVVLAVPLNVLRDLDLGVALTQEARSVIRSGHVGAISKVWTWAPGPKEDSASYGWPDVPESYGVPVPGGRVLAALQIVAAGDSASANEQIAAELTRRHPGLPLAETLAHDWVADPYARGTWYSPGVGQTTGVFDLANQPGPCFFAGGDVSRRWAGWMDGALTSGDDAGARATSFVQTGTSAEARG